MRRLLLAVLLLAPVAARADMCQVELRGLASGEWRLIGRLDSASAEVAALQQRYGDRVRLVLCKAH